jgi:hypothetical protein
MIVGNMALGCGLKMRGLKINNRRFEKMILFGSGTLCILTFGRMALLARMEPLWIFEIPLEHLVGWDFGKLCLTK